MGKKLKKEKKLKAMKKTRKQKIKKMSFSVITDQSYFCVWEGGGPKLHLFDNLAQKARPQKHNKNRGFS